MSNPKRHHFVPESYLKGFLEEGTEFLNIYSKRSDLWRRQKPKKVMVRNKFYHQEWAPEGVDKNILEKMLGASLEPDGLEALKKLIEEPSTLNDNHTADILEYIQFQRTRVPRQADMAKDLAKKAITREMLKTSTGREALKHGKLIIEDSFRFDFMIAVHGVLAPYFSKMIWQIVEAEPGASFVTSDSPVSFYNVDFRPPTEPGVALYGTKVLFPINKKFLLVMLHSEYMTGEKSASESMPETVAVDDGEIELRHGLVWDKAAVSKHNWVMLQLSQDMIVGESKEVLEDAVGKTLIGNK